MTSLLLALLTLVGGYAVNLAIDLIPNRLAFRRYWMLPAERLYPSWFLPKPVYETRRVHRLRTVGVWTAVGIVNWLAYRKVGFSYEMAALCLYAWYFLAIAVIDLEHRLVLNRMLLAGLVFILLGAVILGPANAPAQLGGAAIGFFSFLALAQLRPGSMGMGDVKLAGWIGLALGFPGVISALLIAILSAGIAGLIILVAHRFRRGVTFAYAPYLAFGAWIVLYFNPDFLPF